MWPNMTMVVVNTGADDIIKGSETITLGLMWTLILKYQFRTEAKGEGNSVIFHQFQHHL
jgi:hypothetical protein